MTKRSSRSYDLHIHIPEGAIPKDGPSAGITMATALVSALSNRPIRKNVAMTGEITLRGNVLPIGGVKEKVLAAHRAEIDKVILPILNKKDMEDVPKEAQRDMKFVFVENVREVFTEALLPPVTALAAPESDNRTRTRPIEVNRSTKRARASAVKS